MIATLSLLYLIAAVTYITGLKMLGNPKTARKGNLIAAAGMVVAILGTIFLYDKQVPMMIHGLIWAGIIMGSIAGWIIARKVEMTKMPELVSMFNGMGGASAALIGIIEFQNEANELTSTIVIIAGVIIGSISLSGSMIAWAKLNGNMRSAIRLPKYNLINNIFFIVIFALGVYMVYADVSSPMYIYLLFFLALAYGVLFVIPIGGADMPVVISLLNSFTGIAAAFTGFLFNNMVMLAGGILVGSAGLILTFAMCEAMNRPLSNVVFGAFGGDDGGAQAKSSSATGGNIKKTTPSDAAIMMNYANRVIIVPGYGLAVAQAQHVIHELELLLESKGVEVKYAIHPVAGRMPGHMNVLLAETNVEYDKLVEMDDINPVFSNTDAVLVIGANDVVNPAAHNDPSSPIYGMPILEVENAKSIIINKRSMNPGYAGIQNELFFNSKTSMLFGDAKDVLTKLVQELKNM